MLSSFNGKMKRFHGLKIILLLVISVILFGVCYATYLNVKFAKDMTYDKTLGKAKYIAEENGYIFKYKHAYPWSLNCFASVCTQESTKMYLDDDGEIKTDGMSIILFIWPSIKGYTYGLDMYKNEEETVELQVCINENLQVVPMNDEEQLEMSDYELIQEYQDDINKLMEVAKEKWKIE